MNLIEALQIKPGDVVIYYNGEAGNTSLLKSSQHCGDGVIGIFSGVEYIVSSVGGLSKNQIPRFGHMTQGKPLFDFDENDPIVEGYLELEVAQQSLIEGFFEKRRRDHEEVSEFTIDDFLDEKDLSFIAANEFLVELAKQAPKRNAYNISVEDYMWYLDLELSRTKKNTFEDYEEIYASEKEQAEEDNEKLDYSFSKGFKGFKEEIRQRRIFFEGTRNVCEILTKMYQLKTYGDIIRRFANNGVKIKDVQMFYDAHWLGKKEFQNAIVYGYETKFKIEEFENYMW